MKAVMAIMFSSPPKNIKRSLMAKPTIGITLGDFNGIGPEITLKSILTPSVRRICKPILIGAIDVYEFYARRLRLKIDLVESGATDVRTGSNHIPVINILPYRFPVIDAGRMSKESGQFAAEAITRAAEWCL